MSYYKKHIFFCSNIRADNALCCSKRGGKAMYRYAKDKCRDEGILGAGKIGVSESRCLGRCEYGAVALVYPDNVWYQCVDTADINEIISEHLLGGKVVKRLQIDEFGV